MSSSSFSEESPSPVSICVFCGSGEGNDPAFTQSARSLAELFYKHNWSLGIFRSFQDAAKTKFMAEERWESWVL
jgi:predicted Rossmann-fold nucleotide-binding protein